MVRPIDDEGERVEGRPRRKPYRDEPEGPPPRLVVAGILAIVKFGLMGVCGLIWMYVFLSGKP